MYIFKTTINKQQQQQTIEQIQGDTWNLVVYSPSKFFTDPPGSRYPISGHR